MRDSFWESRFGPGRYRPATVGGAALNTIEGKGDSCRCRAPFSSCPVISHLGDDAPGCSLSPVRGDGIEGFHGGGCGAG